VLRRVQSVQSVKEGSPLAYNFNIKIYTFLVTFRPPAGIA
jgi:hypothetical protein